MFIFFTGVFVSSWIGGMLFSIGEWIIKKVPLVKHIYSAAKQVSAAVNPANEAAKSFRECVIIRHPRNGEFAFGFITGQTLLQVCCMRVCFQQALSVPRAHSSWQSYDGEIELFSVYVPTNHIYVGDMFCCSARTLSKTTCLSEKDSVRGK